ncbi:MAG: DUF5067 domain-containing protein [Atopobiaceae bacterium]|nr:DUF5067 domain-containing protein [Atopobiaceae bacterium]
MFKKAVSITISTLLALSLCACGGNQSPSGSGTASGVPALEELKYYVDQDIDYTLEGGNVKFNHVERANDKLTSADNVLLFVFDFTNAMSDPAEFQRVFKVQYFQNGTELQNNLSYSTAGGEQYELVQAFFSSAMKGGTVTFAQIVQPKDDSPITVMVSPNGGGYGQDEYQMMEVGFGEEPTDVSPSAHFYELGKVFKFGPEKAVSFLEGKGFEYQEAYTHRSPNDSGNQTDAGWVGNPEDNISDRDCLYQLFDADGNELAPKDIAGGAKASRIRMAWYGLYADPPEDYLTALSKDCGFGEVVGKGWLLGVKGGMWSTFSILSINGVEGYTEIRTSNDDDGGIPMLLVEWSAFDSENTKEDFLESMSNYAD